MRGGRFREESGLVIGKMGSGIGGEAAGTQWVLEEALEW